MAGLSFAYLRIGRPLITGLSLAWIHIGYPMMAGLSLVWIHIGYQNDSQWIILSMVVMGYPIMTSLT